MMMTEMDIETSVYYVHLTRLIAREDYIKFTRRESTKTYIHKTVILPFVLYGCETWSLTWREEHRLRVSENRVLRGIFGPKREEEVSWRKLHKDELCSLYSVPNIVRVIESRRMR
jgi:hypothetical protein